MKSFSTLEIALGASLMVHAVLLTVRFVDPAGFNRIFQDTPLEVVLVNSRANEKSDRAQVIAQTSLAGGGDAEKGRATSPLPPSALTEVGDAADDAQKKIDAMQEQQMLLLARLKETLAAMPPPDPKQATNTPEAAAQEEKRRHLVKILAEIERRINEENARPKKRYISPSTREEVYAVYYDRLRRKIEDRGTQNFPEAAGRKLYGELTMIVTVNHDGRILDTEIVESSGNATLDRRAETIAKAAAPFGTFSDAMRTKADQIVVVSRFKFTRDDTLETRHLPQPLVPHFNMDRYCVMGNPVEHSKSPWIHARFAALSGQDLEYGRRLIPMDGFAAALRDFQAEGGKGCNITVPFKFEAGAVVSRCSDRAALAGACNVLSFDGTSILGDNTDGIGLVDDLERNAGVPPAGRDVLLVGAGGAAAGVLGPLIEARPRRIVIANRTLAKARALADSHAPLAAAHGVALQASGLEVAGQFDIVLNGTATSLAGGEVPVSPSVLRPGCLAYDMMYGPAAQGFLAWAQRHGAVARDGLGMLVEQAAEAFLIWRGVRPPSAQVLAELRAEMAA